MAGISRVCTGASNTPDTFRYAHFLPLMRRTTSLRIAWDIAVFKRLIGPAEYSHKRTHIFIVMGDHQSIADNLLVFF